MDERWAQIPGFTKYEASDLGRVRGPMGILGQRPHKTKGYLKVSIFRDGNSPSHTRKINLMVHTCVLLAFVGPRPEGHECRHLNDCKTDNRLCNLAWGTVRENVRDAALHGLRPDNKGPRNGGARLTAEQVTAIRSMPAWKREDAARVASALGVSAHAVRRVRAGRSWVGV